MIRKLDNLKMGHGDHDWLRSVFHFSFADYYNPANIHFGALRVINDDLIQAGTGFDMHPHHDMEIVTYVVEGQLTHADNMGNRNTLSRGNIQYMSAGTGVIHSEQNLGTETCRLLQIWILPDQKGLPPNYGDMRFEAESRHNKWLNIVSGSQGNAPVKIHQDASIFVLELDEGSKIEFLVAKKRQAYLVQVEGKARINDVELNMRDGLESVEESLHIKALEKSHFLVVEMAKGPVN
jgi:quercetin 2,3-dioxygenase